MRRTLSRIGWISLKRDRAAFGLTFILPIAFFTIFGFVLAKMSGGGIEEIDLRVLVVDQDGSEVAKDLMMALEAHDAVTLSWGRPVEVADSAEPSSEAWSREEAHRAVRKGDADAALVLLAGFSTDFGSLDQSKPRVELIFDASNPMTQYTLSGLLQASSFEAAPNAMMDWGLEMLETYGGPLTPQQKQVVEMGKAFGTSGGEPTAGGGPEGLLEIEPVAAHDDDQEDEDGPAMIAYYAAGTGVMFLLFSLTGAAGGLLEEEEQGTLERVLSTNVTMGQLLGSRWASAIVIGVIQMFIMFVWGWLVFDLDLWTGKRVIGVLVMGTATAAAAASFGLVLAAACRSRKQLEGLSTIIILVMSALGGSMMPRFIMPDSMVTISRFTINGWALDGFLKVFWYEDPDASILTALWGLVPEVAVLGGFAVLALGGARRLARRWEVI